MAYDADAFDFRTRIPWLADDAGQLHFGQMGELHHQLEKRLNLGPKGVRGSIWTKLWPNPEACAPATFEAMGDWTDRAREAWAAQMGLKAPVSPVQGTPQQQTPETFDWNFVASEGLRIAPATWTQLSDQVFAYLDAPLEVQGGAGSADDDREPMLLVQGSGREHGAEKDAEDGQQEWEPLRAHAGNDSNYAEPQWITDSDWHADALRHQEARRPWMAQTIPGQQPQITIGEPGDEPFPAGDGVFVGYVQEHPDGEDAQFGHYHDPNGPVPHKILPLVQHAYWQMFRNGIKNPREEHKTAMALLPEQLQQWMAEHGPYAWHITHPSNIPAILQQGLYPWDEGGKPRYQDTDYFQPRPGHVYLHMNELRPRRDPQHQAVLRIDLRHLDPSRFAADEDQVMGMDGLEYDKPIGGIWGDEEGNSADMSPWGEQNGWYNEAEGNWYDRSKGQWAEDNAHLVDQPEHVWQGGKLDTIAYRGSIPSHAIQVRSSRTAEALGDPAGDLSIPMNSFHADPSSGDGQGIMHTDWQADPSRVCADCGRPRPDDGSITCDCGGTNILPLRALKNPTARTSADESTGYRYLAPDRYYEPDDSMGNNWVYLNGQVAFGTHHHRLIHDLAKRVGMDPWKAQQLANLTTVYVRPTGADIALGSMHGEYPQIWTSTVDRNHVFDSVLDAHGKRNQTVAGTRNQMVAFDIKGNESAPMGNVPSHPAECPECGGDLWHIQVHPNGEWECPHCGYYDLNHPEEAGASQFTPGERVEFRGGQGGGTVIQAEWWEGGWWYRVRKEDGQIAFAPEAACLQAGAADQPGQWTLNDFGIPPEGESYYRNASQAMLKEAAEVVSTAPVEIVPVQPGEEVFSFQGNPQTRWDVNGEDRFAFNAVDARTGQMVGSVTFRLIEDYDWDGNPNGQKYLYVQEMFVDPLYRNSQAGLQLMLAVKRAAQWFGVPVKATFANPQLQETVQPWMDRWNANPQKWQAKRKRSSWVSRIRQAM